MSNKTISITMDSILNLVSIFLDMLALFVCLTLISIIIYRLIRIKQHRRLIANDVPLILSIHIICVIFIKTVLQIIHVTIPTLKKDFYIQTEFQETGLYRYRSYMFWSMIGVLYWNYALVAFFSFIRVLYPRKLWLLRPTLYFYKLIPGVYIYVFITLSPLLFFFDSLHPIPGEAYCGIANTPFYPLVYTYALGFMFPLDAMCTFYILIARRMRQTSLIRQSLHQRDYLVLYRISLNIVILTILSLPYVVLYVKSAIENRYESSLYRVQWISSSTGSFLFSCVLPLVSTRLRDFLKPNRPAPGHN